MTAPVGAYYIAASSIINSRDTYTGATYVYPSEEPVSKRTLWWTAGAVALLDVALYAGIWYWFA